MKVPHVAALFAAALLAASPTLAQTDKYPTRTVTLIVPWPAGGSTDAVIRAFASRSTSRNAGLCASRRCGTPPIVTRIAQLCPASRRSPCARYRRQE